MELYIIRHGQSVNNALPEQSARVHDPALTELGMAQAGYTAAYFADGSNRDPWVDPTTGYSAPEEPSFGITHLYSSAMYRALQTAYPMAGVLKLKPEIWLDIHEHGGIYLEQEGKYTGFPGKTRGEITSEFPDAVIPDSVTEKGWWDESRGQETMAAAYGRAAAVAYELKRRAQGDDKDSRIAIVTHGTFIDALLKALFNQLPSRHMFYLHYNTGITRIDFDDRERMLVRFANRVAHLPNNLLT